MAKRGTGLADGAELKPLSLICWGCDLDLPGARNDMCGNYMGMGAHCRAPHICVLVG